MRALRTIAAALSVASVVALGALGVTAPAQAAQPAAEMSASAAAAPAPTACTPIADAGRAPTLPAGKKFLGALKGGIPSDSDALSQVTSDFGVAPNMSLFFYTISSGSHPAADIHSSWSNGMLPVLTLQTERNGAQAADNSDAAVASGAYDSLLCSFFREIADTGQPVIVRLDHEMNGDRYPWVVGGNGNTAADYVSMWIHVHALAAAAGASNIAWMWAPNSSPGGVSSATLRTFYPGDQYVDLLGADAYTSQGTTNPFSAYATLLQALAQINPGKPVILSELGVNAGTSAAADAYRAAFLGQLFPYLSQDPQVRGVIYADRNTDSGASGDYGLAPAPGTGAQDADLAAFRTGIAAWNITPTTTARVTAPSTEGDDVGAVTVTSIVPGTPHLTGAAAVGRTLRAYTGHWTAGTTFSYQWFLAGQPITGATSPTYVLPETVHGHTVTVQITGHQSWLMPQTVAVKSATVAAGVMKTHTVEISGTRQATHTLKARSMGDWGPGSVTLKYRWFRSGTPISDAWGSSYKLRSADARHVVSVRVTGTESGYRTTARSASAQVSARVPKSKPTSKKTAPKSSAPTT